MCTQKKTGLQMCLSSWMCKCILQTKKKLVYSCHGGKKTSQDPQTICKPPCQRILKRLADYFLDVKRKKREREDASRHGHTQTHRPTHIGQYSELTGVLYSKCSSDSHSKHQKSLKHPQRCLYISKVRLFQ